MSAFSRLPFSVLLTLRGDHILREFETEFPERQVDDRLFRGVGTADYVTGVLVPELAVMLIKEDMNVGDERARQILQESRHVGETLHGEA